jgi:PKHD-type hydroxylase
LATRGIGTWTDAFTHAQLNHINHYCDKLPLEEGLTGGGQEKRSCKVAWLPYDDDTKFIYDIVGSVLANLNNQFFRFDLTGMHEPIQYSVYKEGEHYAAWHTDATQTEVNQNSWARKLSFSMQLSRPEEYTGGSMSIKAGTGTFTARKEYGDIVVFPSYVLHRVNPVKTGVRKSLVVWSGGPPFR